MSALRRLGRRAVDVNVMVSRATQSKLGLASDKPLWEAFERAAAEEIRRLPDGATVLDLGGGRRCVYAGAVRPPGRVRIVAVDADAAELALNEDVQEKALADVARGLPFDDATVDLVLSRALLEHVEGVPAAFQHMARVLKPGGVAVHFVPGRYSLFGLAARLLPFAVLLRTVHAVMPWTRGQVEFDVHYDHCHPAGLERALAAAGFSQIQLDLTWAQPGYFEAVYPLFLLQTAYAWLARRLRWRRVAAYMVVRAVR